MRAFEPQDEPRERQPLPLVRLGLILPFVQELDRRRVDTDAVLTSNGLARETVLDLDVFVPVIVVHRFLEDAARVAKDPYLGVSVGESMDVASWPPFVDAVSRATTLMEFLVRLLRRVSDDGGLPVLFIMPVTSVHRTFAKHGEFDAFLEHTRAIAEAEGVALINLDTDHNLPLSAFRDTHHLHESGAELVSQRLAEALASVILERR